MTTPRTFLMETAESEELPFTLTGKIRRRPDEPDGPDEWDETFTVLGDLPSGALADLALSAQILADGSIGYNQLGILRFIRAVLIPEDEARWDLLVHDKRRIVPLDRAGEVMFWITSEKTGRPTGPRPSSPDGPRNESNGSEADSSSPATQPTG